MQSENGFHPAFDVRALRRDGLGQFGVTEVKQITLINPCSRAPPLLGDLELPLLERLSRPEILFT